MKRRSLKFKTFLIGAAVLVLAALSAALIYFLDAGDDLLEINLHYFDNQWRVMPLEIRLDGQSNAELAEEALDGLYALGGLTFVLRGIEGDAGVVILPEDFGALSQAASVSALAKVVYSLTEFDFINEVVFMEDGLIAGAFRRDNMLLDSALLPEMGGYGTFVLYYGEYDGAGLVTIEREIILQPGKPIETLLIEELISPKIPPEGGDFRVLLPAGARLRTNTIVESEVCYVDFAADFLAQMDSEEAIILAVDSIVNTITTNTSATSVRLLFAGDSSAVVLEGMELDRPLFRAE